MPWAAPERLSQSPPWRTPSEQSLQQSVEEIDCITSNKKQQKTSNPDIAATSWSPQLVEQSSVPSHTEPQLDPEESDSKTVSSQLALTNTTTLATLTGSGNAAIRRSQTPTNGPSKTQGRPRETTLWKATVMTPIHPTQHTVLPTNMTTTPSVCSLKLPLQVTAQFP